MIGDGLPLRLDVLQQGPGRMLVADQVRMLLVPRGGEFTPKGPGRMDWVKWLTRDRVSFEGFVDLKLAALWDEAEACEKAYSGYVLRDPILGYSADEHMEQFRHIANRCARQLSIEEPLSRCAVCVAVAG